jgi:hypothetical protein
MALVVLAVPDSAAELMTSVGLLRAHSIPCHVRGEGFGSLYPSLQLQVRNGRAIMVAEEDLTEARALLAAVPLEPFEEEP